MKIKYKMLRNLSPRPVLERLAGAIWQLSMLGFKPGEGHFSRYSMYKSLRSHLAGASFGDKVLSISHSDHLCELFGIPKTNIIQANYPTYNICDLSLPNESVTSVISDQVFEHISCVPNRAVDECYRVLVPGGLAIHTTCFLMPYHGSSDYNDRDNGDYWRFTPSGLRLLHGRYSKIICAAGWGTPLMNVFTSLGLHRMPVPQNHWHPLNALARCNRASYAYVVWVVAQK